MSRGNNGLHHDEENSRLHEILKRDLARQRAPMAPSNRYPTEEDERNPDWLLQQLHLLNVRNERLQDEADNHQHIVNKLQREVDALKRQASKNNTAVPSQDRYEAIKRLEAEKRDMAAEIVQLKDELASSKKECANTKIELTESEAVTAELGNLNNQFILLLAERDEEIAALKNKAAQDAFQHRQLMKEVDRLKDTIERVRRESGFSPSSTNTPRSTQSSVRTSRTQSPALSRLSIFASPDSRQNSDPVIATRPPHSYDQPK